MRGVIITGGEGEFLDFDLIDVLKAIGLEAANATWEIADVESVGARSEELHRLSDARLRVNGRILLELAAEVSQVIDGLFTAYKNPNDPPWVVVKAVDSSLYHVWTDDERVIDLLRANLKNVTEEP